ncbi:C-4 methylsterol oxidase [Aureococcus anophagefferens]|nr:C-4 methylsterol oxidase [Aureococcus anophagefferens]
MLAAYHALYSAARALFESERNFWVVAISLAHGVTLLSTSACFLALDRFPSMDKYRLQDKRAPEALFRQAFRGLFFNSAVTYPVFALLLYPIARGFVSDCLFYWIHRTLHHKSIYKYVHKTHHEFKQNVAPAAEHFHPAEDVMNVIPFLAGPLLFRVHFATLLLWVVVRVHEIVDAHSGYGLPWSPWSYTRPSERHEFHHSHNQGCYGSFFPFWDWAFSTDAQFRAFMAKGAWRNAARPRREGPADAEQGRQPPHAAPEPARAAKKAH